MNRRIILLGLAALAMLAVASASMACPVCFGESDSPIVKGAEYSILFMMGVTYALIGGGLATAIFLRRRQRRRQDDVTPEGCKRNQAETAKEL